MTQALKEKPIDHNNQRYVDGPMRFEKVENRLGITGIDHLGLACRDPDKSGKFLEQVLGATEAFRFGYSDRDRELGRFPHIFYRFGDQLLEVVVNEDGTGYPDKTTDNTNPHWSFGGSPEAMARLMASLEEHGIPYNGPRSHNATCAVSIYFVDLDGNKLEMATWDPIPEGLFKMVPIGGQHGIIKWSELNHNWEPK